MFLIQAQTPASQSVSYVQLSAAWVKNKKKPVEEGKRWKAIGAITSSSMIVSRHNIHRIHRADPRERYWFPIHCVQGVGQSDEWMGAVQLIEHRSGTLHGVMKSVPFVVDPFCLQTLERGQVKL